MKTQRSIRPAGMPSPSVAVPTPTPEPQPEPAPEPTSKLTPTWKLTDNNRYWHRPLRNGDREALVMGTTFARIHTEDSVVYALTLQLAADFDTGKI